MKVDWDSSTNQFFLNPRFSPNERAHLTLLISQVESSFQGHLFVLSSGTTARSAEDLKWAALSKSGFLASAQGVNSHLQSTSSDVWLHPLPDFHVGGLGIWARSHLSQAKVVKLPVWSASEFVSQVLSCRATLTSLVPAQIYDLVNSRQMAPSSLRAVLVGGGALSPVLYQKALDLGWPVLPTYGMTEACSQVATARLNSLSKDRSREAGLPVLEILPHVQVRVGEGGKLRLFGSSLLSAYVFQGETGAQVFDPKEQGWFQTQDCGEVEDRFLKILGRLGDFIKIGGESVELGRLNAIFEEIRVQMGLNADISLLPVPDERLGHVIHLVSNAELTLQDSVQFIELFNARVLAFERIRRWNPLTTLPRTALGKLIPSECLKLLRTS
jgi:O-succinylbenzoic acid--CoA ligase